MKHKQVQYRIVIIRNRFMKKHMYNIVFFEEKSEKAKYKVGNFYFDYNNVYISINFDVIKKFWINGNLNKKSLNRFVKILYLINNYNKN